MSARTFYLDEASGAILIANSNTYSDSELADMAANPYNNLDKLKFHSSLKYIAVKGRTTRYNVTIPALVRESRSWSEGSGCKIICTKLFEYGLLPAHIYQADQEFGLKLQQKDPIAYQGYIRWAKVVVNWMEETGPNFMFWVRNKEKRAKAQRNFFIKLTRHIATPWAYHMAYLMGYEPKDNFAGKLIMRSGLFISKLVGKNKSAEVIRPFTSYFLLVVLGCYFSLLASISR